MAFPHSFPGSTSSSFNNVSRSILLFVRVPLQAALAGKARSSTLPLRSSRAKEFETNGLSCFRLCSAGSGKSLKGLPIDTQRYFCRFSIYSTCLDIYEVSTIARASRIHMNNLKKFFYIKVGRDYLKCTFLTIF